MKYPELMYEESQELIINALTQYHEKLREAKAKIHALEVFKPQLDSEVHKNELMLARSEYDVWVRKIEGLEEQLARTVEHDIPQIKERVDIREVIGKKVHLKRRGNKLIGLCPFHSEKTPSFTVYEKDYYCFGCGACGDVISFVMNSEGIGFKEAVGRLL